MKILLADDDNSLRKVLLFKLKQKGYDVVAVVKMLTSLDAFVYSY